MITKHYKLINNKGYGGLFTKTSKCAGVGIYKSIGLLHATSVNKKSGNHSRMSLNHNLSSHCCIEINNLFYSKLNSILFDKKMDERNIFVVRIKSTEHPNVKASHFILQRTLAHYEYLMKDKPALAETILSTKLLLEDGIIELKVTMDSTVTWLKNNFPKSWTDSSEKIKLETGDAIKERVKFNIKVLNLGDKDEETYRREWEKWNDSVKLNTSSWKILPGGGNDRGDGFLILHLTGELESLKCLKDASGKHFMNTGISGRTFVNIFRRQDPGEKRKYGFVPNNPNPKKPK